MAPVSSRRHNVEEIDVRGDLHEEDSVDSDGDEDESSRVGSDSSGEEQVGSKGDDESGDNDEAVEQRIANISFGALKQAQDKLSRKRKRGSDVTADQDEKLEALRARLSEIRSKPKASNNTGKSGRATVARVVDVDGSRTKKSALNSANDELGVDSDSAPSEEETNTKSRTSKHAPASQSSRHQVTRKRTVIDVPKRTFRDPRFDALRQRSEHAGNSGKAYSFLRDYEKDEIAELKSAIKQARNEDDRETLKRKMISMQNKIKSEEAKEREQEVVRQHRREEKDKVESGKKPFYLKRKDVKERAIVEKFKGMKSKDREKLMEKRRKKEGQKEKRRMPEARRLNG